VHVFSHSVKLCRAVPVAGCPRSPATLLWVRWLIWVLDGAFRNTSPTSRPRHDSPWLGASEGNWSFMMNFSSWPEAMPVRCVSVVDSNLSLKEAQCFNGISLILLLTSFIHSTSVTVVSTAFNRHLALLFKWRLCKRYSARKNSLKARLSR